jgi:hypothetical protein
VPCAPAAAATFAPAPGTFTSPQLVRLSTKTPGAVIRYTTDGTVPTERSPAYKGDIMVAETTTIKAMAHVPGTGQPRSAVSSGTYAIAPPRLPRSLRASPPLHRPGRRHARAAGAGTEDPVRDRPCRRRASSKSLLDAVAGALQEHPEVDRVVIEGHTDAQGGDAVNEKLSKHRAEAVREYLIDKGVEPERLETKGFGSSQPIADNATPEGREANRRVDFIVVAPGPAREREMGTGSSAGDTGAGGAGGTGAGAGEKDTGSNPPSR